MINYRKQGLLGGDPLDQYTQNWQSIDAADVPMGQAEEKPASWLQGGDKFGWKEGLSLALAGIGDAFAAQNGDNPQVMQGMMARAMSAREAARKAQIAAAERDRLVQAGIAAGRTPDQMDLVLGGAANYNDFKPDEFEAAMARAGIQRGTPEYQQAAQRKAMGDPFLTGAPLPNGGQYYGYASGLPGVLNGAGSSTDANEWDSATPLGGAGSSPRPFRY